MYSVSVMCHFGLYNQYGIKIGAETDEIIKVVELIFVKVEQRLKM